MRRIRKATLTLLAVGVLFSSVLTTTPVMAKGGGTGVGWEYHEEGDGYYRPPSGEGPGQDDDGDTYWPPNKDGFFEKTEVGSERDGDVFVWRCNPKDAISPNTGDTHDELCGAAYDAIYCNQVTGLRPMMPNVDLVQDKDWHDLPNETDEKPLVKYDGEWDSDGTAACREIPDEDWVSSEEISKAAVEYKVFQQLG